MRLARKVGSARLLQLLAVASSPPDKPRKSYLIRRTLSLGPLVIPTGLAPLKKAFACHIWRPGSHLPVLQTRGTRSGAARAGKRSGGIGAYPSKRLLPARPRGVFLRPFAKPCFGQLLTAYVTFLQHIGKKVFWSPRIAQQQQSARVKRVKQFHRMSQNDLGCRGVYDEIYNPNCDRRRIDRNARFCSGYGGSPSTTTRAGL